MIKSLFNRKKTRFCQHRGMTLVELLVVSAIMVLLMSVAIPVLSPITANRMVRESARGVVTAMESARSRAMQTGRPCGVAFMPFHTDYRRSCIQVEQLSARPAYVGTYSVNGNSITVNPPGNMQLHRGDVVQLNYTGPRFVVQTDGSNSLDLTAWSDSSRSLKYDYSGFGNFSNECVIHTFPVFEKENAFAKALGIVTSFLLPKGYIVDLSCSGYGNENSTAFESIQVDNMKRPPMIIFNPDGSAVLYSNGKPLPSRTFNDLDNPPKIILLVGKWDQMEGVSLEEGAVRNDKDYDSFWIIVNPKTGRITMAQNVDQGLTNAIVRQEFSYGANR